MANPTSNFGWQMPTNTDLVKDLPADFETFGQAVDSDLADLKGGTTGQVLSKNSDTDMDFAWVTSDDANAIQNSIINAKGDLIVGSANDTPAILSVAADGSSIVADSAESTGLRWQGNYSAGKNKIINGAFDIWQRGTSFSSPTSGAYTADRFYVAFDGSGATRTISQETFTPGTAPVAGYEGQYFYRNARTVAGTGATFDTIRTRIEDVRTLAGQTATFSFWAKVNSGTSDVVIRFSQGFGSGGSTAVNTDSSSITLTTTWTRYSVTFSVPSVSGKTIGSGSYIELQFRMAVNVAVTVDLWGIQLEAGNVSTSFQTATGTLQGESEACLRYYNRLTTSNVADGSLVTGDISGVYALGVFNLPTTMRANPTVTLSGTVRVNSNVTKDFTAFAGTAGTKTIRFVLDTVSGFTVGYAHHIDLLGVNSYLEISAEL